MFKNNKTAKAVRLALIAGATTTVLTLPSAFAADKEKEGVERIEVTGSRIKRTDLEGASPVTIMTTADMKIEGNFTVADALRGSSLNSFGSFSERSGSSAQSQATINLRGAGSNRTLVLLDGKRLPGSPTLGGQSANLNSIPMAAVERIEILTDGASSTYGSDAIAGVVNIIMKKDFEGLQFNIGAGHRDRDEGTTSNEFSVTGGYATDKGNITFSFDHQKRQGISDGARDYTKAKMSDVNGDGTIQAYSETDGWSIYGATVASPDFEITKASPLCDDLVSQYGEDTFRKVAADDDWGPGSEYCMYAYGNVSYNKASIDRNTLYVDANYEVADDVEWFGRAMFVRNSSFGRYAPPAAAWNNMSPDSAHNPYPTNDDGNYLDSNGDIWIERDSDGNPVLDDSGATKPYTNTTGYYRWVGIGTRDGNVDDYNEDYLTGLRGELNWKNATWEVYYHRNIADNKAIGEYYLSYGGLAHNEANKIALDSPEGIANLKATTLQQSSSSFNQYYGGMGLDLGEISGSPISHYFGMEYLEQTYSDIYDGQSEAGQIGGSSGNSAQGERDIFAVFWEAALPITDDVEINLAARYDDYSDFGDNVAPKASLRWQITDDIVLRTSYSEAFRAPGLDELNAATSFSAESAIDYKTGATTSKQFDTYYKSNSSLGAETSEYINLGLAWDINDNFSLKVDYFDLEIEDVIQTKSVQSLLSDEAAGKITALAPGSNVDSETFYLIRTSGGKLLEAGTGYFNGVGFNIKGIDVTFNSNFETEVGEFRFDMVNSFVLDYKEERGGRIYDTSGWAEQPDHKAVATFSWSMEDHSVAWNVNYTAGTYETEKPDDTTGIINPDGALDSWTIHNLTYTYNADQYGSIRFTVNNVTDEDPVLNSAGQHDYPSLYNNFGREYRISYTIAF